MKNVKFLLTYKMFYVMVLAMLIPLGGGFLHSVASAAEWSTPTFGGGGGTRSYNLDCGRGSVMVGLINKSGSWLDAIGIICRKVNSRTGQLGEEFTRGPVGGIGGTAKIEKCPSGAVMNTVKVQSGQFVNLLGHECYNWDAGRKRPNGEFRYRNGNGAFVRAGKPCMLCNYSHKFICPTGKVAKALRGRYGGYIDSTRFVCDAWDQ